MRAVWDIDQPVIQVNPIADVLSIPLVIGQQLLNKRPRHPGVYSLSRLSETNVDILMQLLSHLHVKLSSNALRTQVSLQNWKPG